MYKIKSYLALLCAVFIFGQGWADDAALNEAVQALGTKVNQALKGAGKNVQLQSVEIYSADNLGGQEVIINTLKGGLQNSTTSHWVAYDPRRAGFGIPGDALLYAVDRVDGEFSGVGTDGSPINIPYESVVGAFENGVNVWRGVHCRNNLTLIGNDPGSEDIGIAQLLFGWGGGSFAVAGDIQFGGFLPPAVFDTIRPDGGNWLVRAHDTSRTRLSVYS